MEHLVQYTPMPQSYTNTYSHHMQYIRRIHIEMHINNKYNTHKTHGYFISFSVIHRRTEACFIVGEASFSISKFRISLPTFFWLRQFYDFVGCCCSLSRLFFYFIRFVYIFLFTLLSWIYHFRLLIIIHLLFSNIDLLFVSNFLASRFLFRIISFLLVCNKLRHVHPVLTCIHHTRVYSHSLNIKFIFISFA